MSEDAIDRARALQSLLMSETNVSVQAKENRRQAEDLVATLHEDEITMLRQIVTGWSKAESAAELGIEPYQFEKRRAALFVKLNAGSTTDAVRVGIYAGLE